MYYVYTYLYMYMHTYTLLSMHIQTHTHTLTLYTYVEIYIYICIYTCRGQNRLVQGLWQQSTIGITRSPIASPLTRTPCSWLSHVPLACKHQPPTHRKPTSDSYTNPKPALHQPLNLSYNNPEAAYSTYIEAHRQYSRSQKVGI